MDPGRRAASQVDVSLHATLAVVGDNKVLLRLRERIIWKERCALDKKLWGPPLFIFFVCVVLLFSLFDIFEVVVEL